tara:strand:+ start:936 stop:1544 length:609 start_codon:yes stop_codon:yes gene_type:complete
MSAQLPHYLFLFFAALAIAFSVLVITMNNPVRSALALVFVFFAASALWLLMQAEFLALILVLVYVGAVMTLFLFVVMMINVDSDSMAKHFMSYVPIGVIILSVIVSTVIKILPEQLMFAKTVVASVIPMTNTESLGSVLYTEYVYAFELAAVLLLVAIISAIALVHRQRNRGKRQDIVKQIMTSKVDRLKIIKMAPVTTKKV